MSISKLYIVLRLCAWAINYLKTFHMKANLLLTIVLLCCFFQNAFCQEYHPFLNNSSWLLKRSSSQSPTYERMMSGGTDAVVGNYTYKKIKDAFRQMNWVVGIDELPLRHTYIDTVYVREDIATKKVYHLVNGVDKLLYDFNMGIGDTISQYRFKWEVIVVDSVEVDGGFRKRIKLRIVEPYNGHRLVQRWIEGVGSNAHPFYPQVNMYNVISSSGGSPITTMCSFQDDVHIYGDLAYCGAALGTEENVIDNEKIDFYPNPFRTELTISSSLPLQNVTLRLYDIRGQMVRKVDNLSGMQLVLNRENLNSGLYLIQLSEDGEIIKSMKIIVE